MGTVNTRNNQGEKGKRGEKDEPRGKIRIKSKTRTNKKKRHRTRRGGEKGLKKGLKGRLESKEPEGPRCDNEAPGASCSSSLHPRPPHCGGGPGRRRGPGPAGALGPLRPPVAAVGPAGPVPPHVLPL